VCDVFVCVCVCCVFVCVCLCVCVVCVCVCVCVCVWTDGWTALHLASRERQESVVSYLVFKTLRSELALEVSGSHALQTNTTARLCSTL
jgi:hypothetical protein